MERNVTQDALWREESESLELPRLATDLQAQVCVIGLGGAGLACLAELGELGIDAVGLDASGVAHGAAGRNGGFLLSGLPDFHHRAIERFGHGRALGLYRATVTAIERMSEDTPDLVRLSGSLRIAASDRELDDCRAQLAAMEADGLGAEWYEGDEGRGLLIPWDGTYQPLARCRALARRLVEDGAQLYEHSPAERIQTGRVVTPGGRVTCDRVIVAVDGALERLLPDLEGRVRTARLQMLTTEPEDRVRFPRPVYTRWGYDFWQQLPDGRIALGGMRDTGGDSEWTVRAVPTDDIQRELNYLLHRIGVRARVTHRWAGVAGYSTTGLPIFEEVRPGVLAVGGYSGTGNAMGTLLGREAARWVAGRETPVHDLIRGD